MWPGGFFDACRSGILVTPKGLLTRAPPLVITVPSAGPAGRFLVVSSGASELSYESVLLQGSPFAMAVRSGIEGAPVFNLGGTKASMSEVVSAIDAAVPSAAGSITVSGAPMPVPEDVDGSPAEAAIGAIGWRPFDVGVAETIAAFKAAADAGRIDVDRAIS